MTKDEITHYYQLVLYGTTSEEILYPVFHSRLYTLYKECIRRCISEEMKGIIDAIARHYPGQLEEDVEEYIGTEKEYLKLVAKVTKWLKSEKDDWFIEPPELTNDNDPLSWSIECYKIAK